MLELWQNASINTVAPRRAASDSRLRKKAAESESRSGICHDVAARCGGVTAVREP